MAVAAAMEMFKVVVVVISDGNVRVATTVESKQEVNEDKRNKGKEMNTRTEASALLIKVTLVDHTPNTNCIKQNHYRVIPFCKVVS